MNRYVLIATRHTDQECNDTSLTIGKLNEYYKQAGWQVKFMRNCKSIFEAYHKGFQSLDADDNDVVILCHDDIEMTQLHDYFNRVIDHYMKRPSVGFLGVAGSKKLAANHGNWTAGLHSYPFPHGGAGMVGHGPDVETCSWVSFGIETKAVVMDGLWLCAKASVLKQLELRKPKTFEGNWHWYDHSYCVQAKIKGYDNYIIPIFLRHASTGNYDELFYKDMKNFHKLFRKHLPIVVD